MTDGITSAEGRLLSVQMGAIREDMKEVKNSLLGMSLSLDKLVRIEEQQGNITASLGRAFDEIKDERKKREQAEERLRELDRLIPERLKDRVADIEKTLPGLREARGWAITCALGTFGTIGFALVTYFFQWHVR